MYLALLLHVVCIIYHLIAISYPAPSLVEKSLTFGDFGENVARFSVNFLTLPLAVVSSRKLNNELAMPMNHRTRTAHC